KPGAFDQPGAQNRMPQVGVCFGLRSNGELFGRRTGTQALQLWENKPHPVRLFAAAPQFRAHLVKDRGLGIDEPLQIVRIIHHRYSIVIQKESVKMASMIGRPQATEAAPHYFTYINRIIVQVTGQVTGDDPISIIEGQLEESIAFFTQISEETSLH